MHAPLDITGKRFGRLTAIRLSHRTIKHSFWLCRCECGVERVVPLNALRRGAWQSCGCQKRETAGKASITHGLTRGRKRPPEYAAWCGMRNRCYNPRVSSYPHYGGRGITVCKAWRESFEQFLADMGPRPPGLSIERKDNNGPYSPANCIWATRQAQGSNKRNSKFLTINGKRMPIAAACALLGIPLKVMYQRIYRGWPIERLGTPLRHQNN